MKRFHDLLRTMPGVRILRNAAPMKGIFRSSTRGIRHVQPARVDEHDPVHHVRKRQGKGQDQPPPQE
jgi:hypothetical protein